VAELRLLRADSPIQEAAGLLREALAGLERPRLAVSGGSAVAALALARKALGVHWGQVRLTWADERRVPFGDPASNRGEAYRLGCLDPLDPPALELPLYLDGETPVEACRRVEAGLDADFGGGLDLLLLGLGEDGHSASLFPGRPWPGARVHAVDASPKPPSGRMTLGLALLASAPAAVMLALGEAKAPALRRLLAGDPSLPASALGRLTVVTDLDLNTWRVSQGAQHG
jgi:6-phosphogluconolactonase